MVSRSGYTDDEKLIERLERRGYDGQMWLESHESRRLFALARRAAQLEIAVADFRRDAGRHDGDHEYAGECKHCTTAYVEAEAVLYDTLGDYKWWAARNAAGGRDGDE